MRNHVNAAPPAEVRKGACLCRSSLEGVGLRKVCQRFIEREQIFGFDWRGNVHVCKIAALSAAT